MPNKAVTPKSPTVLIVLVIDQKVIQVKVKCVVSYTKSETGTDNTDVSALLLKHNRLREFVVADSLPSFLFLFLFWRQTNI